MTDVFIHPSADVSANTSRIGNGSKIWNLVQVRENVSIGNDCILSKNVYVDEGVIIGNRVKIQNNVSVYKGVTIEDDVFVGPLVVFTNDLVPRAFNKTWNITETKVRTGASLGANSVIVCGVTIGEYAMVGAGAVVTKDVRPNTLVLGNPAREVAQIYNHGGRVTEDHIDHERQIAVCPETNETLKVDDF